MIFTEAKGIIFTNAKATTNARFAISCLLSLVAVALFQILPPTHDVNTLVRLAVILIASFQTYYIIYTRYIAYIATYIDEGTYTLAYVWSLSVGLVFLGYIATWTRTYLAVVSADMESNALAQVCSIHFSMAFYLLSRCAFRRPVNKRRRQGQHPVLGNMVGPYTACPAEDPVEDPVEVESTPIFDNRTYFFAIPESIVQEWGERRLFTWPFTWPSPAYREAIVLSLIAHYFFMQGMGCLNYPIKRFANPDPGDTFPLRKTITFVFFSPKYSDEPWWTIMSILEYALQLPVRTFNNLLFWAMVKYVGMALGWVKRWAKSQDEILVFLHALYEISTR